MRRALPLSLLCAAACAAGGGMAPPGVPISAMRPDDRVVLGDFTFVRAVAAAFDRVYVVYDQDIGIWDPIAQTWEVPRRAPNPGVLRDAFAALVDPLDQSVWIATRSGWVRYSPETDMWERGTLTGTVQAMGIDPQEPIGGPWLRTATGWVQQGRAGPAMPGTPPRTLRLAPSVEDAMRAMPQLRALGATIAIGPGLRPGRLTAAAPAADGRGWFLGTSTIGLLWSDMVAMRPEPLPLGIDGEQVGAIARVGDGLWVVTDADVVGRLPAVTYLPEALGRSTPLQGAELALPFSAARALLPGDRRLWIGTDRGLVEAPLDGGRPTLRGEGSGLPVPQVTALAQWGDRIAIGTSRGLALLDNGTLSRAAPGLIVPIHALLARRDTLWVASAIGLGTLLDGDTTVRVSTGWREAVGGSMQVLGVGYVGDTLVAMTPERLLWRDPLGGAWTAGPLLTAGVGRLRVMAPTATGVWVGGDRGASLVQITIGPIRTLMVGRELPAPVTAMVAGDRYLWFGTLAGLVRFTVVPW